MPAEPTRWNTAQMHELDFWRHAHKHGYGQWTWPDLFLKQGEAILSLLSKIKPVSEFAADGAADVVFSRNVLDHVDSPTKWLAEFVRVMRPGGAFLLYVNLVEDWDKEGVDAETHPHSFTEEKVLELLRPLPLRFKYYVDRPAQPKSLGHEIPIIVSGTRIL